MLRPCVRAFAVLGLAVLPAASCSDPLIPVDRLPAALADPALETGGWTHVERPGFSIRMPPGFQDLGLLPIDSDAAAWEDAHGSRLHWDYGPYTAHPSVPEGASEVVDVQTRIGGREAVLQTYRLGGGWTATARWDGLASDTFGDHNAFF